MSCLAANLSSFVLDFVASAKIQGANINWYIVEQLPVIAKEGYDRRFGTKTAREIVRYHVLRLTYTAHDMAPFALDLGYDGPPFIWNEEERRHLRARLDALYFHLYGVSREDASYIMDTFPIVRRHDEKALQDVPHQGDGTGLHERPRSRRHGHGRSGLTASARGRPHSPAAEPLYACGVWQRRGCLLGARPPDPRALTRRCRVGLSPRRGGCRLCLRRGDGPSTGSG